MTRTARWVIVGMVVGAVGCKGKDDASSCPKVAKHMHELMRGDRPAMAGIDESMVKILESSCVESDYTPKFRACAMAATKESDLLTCMGAPASTITCAKGTHVGPEPPEEDSESTRIRATFTLQNENNEWEEYCRVGGEKHGPYRRIELREGHVISEEVGAFENGEKAGTWKTTRHGKPRSEEGWAAGRKQGTHTFWGKGGAKLSENTYKDGEPEGAQRRWYGAEQPAEEQHYTDGKKDGAFIEWHESGNKKSELVFANGVATGPHLEWHENGDPSVQGAYVAGELHGPWRELDEAGKLLVDGAYDRGRKSGVWTERRSNGSKLSERTYAADKGTGKWTFFDAKDAVVVSITLGQDDEVEIEEEAGVPTTIDVKPREGPSTHLAFFPSGSMRVRGGFLDGEKHGPWIELDRAGRKVVDLVYKNGKKHGPASSFHEDSKQLADQGTMDEGEWNGPWKQWYADGKLRMEGVYVHGKRDGLWTEYHPKGHKWREGKFRLDVKYGTWTTWDANAEVATTEELGP